MDNINFGRNSVARRTPRPKQIGNCKICRMMLLDTQRTMWIEAPMGVSHVECIERAKAA